MNEDCNYYSDDGCGLTVKAEMLANTTGVSLSPDCATCKTYEPKNIMSLGYYDDGKGKYQSFEVGLDYKKIQEELSKRYKDFQTSTLDLETLRGYGETKE